MESNFGAVINALVASFLTNARNLFHRLVGGALGRAPFIGDTLQRAWNNWVEVAWQDNQRWIEAALGALVGVVRRPTDVANALMAANSGVIAAISGSLWRLYYVNIPAAEQRAEQYASQLVTWLHQETLRLIEQANAYALTLRDQAVYYAQVLHAQALDYARQLQQQALDFASVLHQQETAYAQALYDQGIAYARALNEQETAFTRVGIEQAEAYARALQEQALGFTKDVEDFARAGILQTEGYARALFQDLAQEQIKGERRSEDYAFKLVQQIYALPCIQQCEPLGDLGSSLASLDLLSLVVQVVEWGTHPDSAKRELLDRFEAPGREIVSQIHGLLGSR